MRKYSLSDRCRYYLDEPEVEEAQQKLFKNINAMDIPIGIISQYLPRQCEDLLAGGIGFSAQDLVCRQVEYALEMYEQR